MTRTILALTLCASAACLTLPVRAEPSMAASNDRLVLTGSQMTAPGYAIPPGMLLCRSMDDALSPTHAGCWLARGGQKVEGINAMPTVSQIIVRTTDGSEVAVVYGLRADADKLQQVAR